MGELGGQTPRGNRLHIGFFGRTNSGKSTLINMLAGQDISIVSEQSGTTTDPVYKSMELLPLGPVLLVDTAGLDDDSPLGAQRIKKTMEEIGKMDVAILVISSRQNDLELEQGYLQLFGEKNTPVVAVLNKFESGHNRLEKQISALNIPWIKLNGADQSQASLLKKLIIQHADFNFEDPSLTGGLVKKGDLVVLVMPQDIQAPKGRLILPQVQVIRDLLDQGCRVISVKTDDLPDILKDLRCAPDLVITDSQVFAKVNEMLPKEIPLTSFSVLFSKNKGDVSAFIEGAKAIDQLHPGDKVLIMESCTHHALEGDIARQKLPAMLEKYVGGAVGFDVFSGPGFPENILDYKLVLQCGGCMINRKNMLTKLSDAQRYGVPITNFGIAIAFMNHMLERIVF